VLTTVPSLELGERIARSLVEDRLAACVNILPPMVSIYRWKGTVEKEEERQLVVKTSRARVADVERRIADLHSYDLPELLVVPVQGSRAYCGWVAGETATG